MTEHYPPKKNNKLLVSSILITLLCCQVLGVVSIVYAALAQSEMDDIKRESHEKMARTFMWIGFGIGLLIYIAYGLSLAFNLLEGEEFDWSDSISV